MSLTIEELIEWAELQPRDHIITIKDMSQHGSGEPPEETNIHLEKSPGQYDDEFVIDCRQARAID